jgi:Tfp pilus assembly protein FimT
MPPRPAEKGQSLVQLMLVVAILGIMSSLVAKLTGKVTLNWLAHRLQSRISYSAESARAFLGSQMRDASIASVVISRQATGQPLLSKISWVDASGNSCTVYQVDSKLYRANWSGNVTTVAKVGIILNEGLERFVAYYPDVKDPSKVAMNLVLSKKLMASSVTPAQLSVVVELELKNP